MMDIVDVLEVLDECAEVVRWEKGGHAQALVARIEAAHRALSVWVAKDRIATQREAHRAQLVGHL